MAANDTILQGTDWGNDAHWGGDTAVKPVDNDNAWISGQLKANITGTPDQGGVDLDLLYIPAEFTHELMTVGAPLLIAADLIEHYGAGGVHIAADAGGAADKIDMFRGQCVHPNVVSTLDSNAADAGEWTTMLFERGTYVIGGNLLWDANGLVNIGYVTNPATDVTLTITSGADALATLRQDGGRVYSARAITTAFVGGTMTQTDAAIGTAYILPGGTLHYNTTSTLGTVVVHRGATLDLLGGGMLYKTITNPVIAMPGSTVLYNPELVSMTFARPTPAAPTGADYRRPMP